VLSTVEYERGGLPDPHYQLPTANPSGRTYLVDGNCSRLGRGVYYLSCVELERLEPLRRGCGCGVSGIARGGTTTGTHESS
jgi:hypothetical protein